jgi:hypothetical protein
MTAHNLPDMTVVADAGMVMPPPQHQAPRSEVRCACDSVRIVERTTNTINGVLPLDS